MLSHKREVAVVPIFILFGFLEEKFCFADSEALQYVHRPGSWRGRSEIYLVCYHEASVLNAGAEARNPTRVLSAHLSGSHHYLWTLQAPDIHLVNKTKIKSKITQEAEVRD